MCLGGHILNHFVHDVGGGGRREFLIWDMPHLKVVGGGGGLTCSESIRAVGISAFLMYV